MVPMPSIELLRMKYLSEAPLKPVAELETKFEAYPLEQELFNE